ncbi:MAG: 4-(cytidine 5'-diphospho)-2-C-methyl-D-erythritol kinase [Muribaculum sp.]|nr:4-(cytidine 5'-diphospho)-2-C-methyl-D-erythritol kinase [Muribaculum sp.]
MILFPNAKINLGLNVVRKRPDGYHDLSTLFYPVGWCDILEIVPSDKECTTLHVSGRGVDCPPDKNLVMKAYTALSEVVGLPPVDIYLHKVIPDGAGLGGGSSDAAFTLVGLNRMFSLGLSDSALAEVAVSVGADCPFFVYNRPMLASGIGDIFSSTDLSLSGFVLAIVKPDEYVSTKEAYAGVSPCLPLHEISDIVSKPVYDWSDSLVNDFEVSIFPGHPAIASLKSRLYELGALYASMSGSGASVYGIFADIDADRLSAILEKEFPGMSKWCGYATY